MSEDQNYEVSRNEANEMIAEETFLGDLMRIVIDQVKAIQKPWEQLSESDQETYLNSVRLQCEAAVKKAINIIAAQGMVTIVADVDSVTFKDGIKAVLKVGSHVAGRHDLADAEGKAVLLVVSSAEDLINENELPEAEPDQPVMDFEDEAA